METITKENIKRGLEIEKEITEMRSENIHVAEERNQRALNDADETGLYEEEEMKYSGVVRSDAKKNNGVLQKAKFEKFKTFNKQIDTKGFKKMKEAAIERLNSNPTNKSLFTDIAATSQPKPEVKATPQSAPAPVAQPIPSAKQN